MVSMSLNALQRSKSVKLHLSSVQERAYQPRLSKYNSIDFDVVECFKEINKCEITSELSAGEDLPNLIQ